MQNPKMNHTISRSKPLATSLYLQAAILLMAFTGLTRATQVIDGSEIQFNGDYKSLKKSRNEASLVSRLHIKVDDETQSSSPTYIFKVVLFDQNNLFSRGIFMISALKLNPSTK